MDSVTASYSCSKDFLLLLDVTWGKFKSVVMQGPSHTPCLFGFQGIKE